MTRYRLGLDIGGTKTLGVLVDPAGSVVASALTATVPGPGVADVAVAVARACEEQGRARAEFVGVGVPGVVADGVVLNAVNLGLDELRLGELLEGRFGVPVALANDVKAAALGARHALGADGAFPDDLAYVNFGTGVSAGCLVGGRVLDGHAHAAGEIGHLIVDASGEECRCGQRGCIETLAGGRSIARRLERLKPAVGLGGLVDAARLGHTGALAELALVRSGIAAAVTALALTLDAPTIVLGGGVIHAGRGLVDDVRDELRRRAEASGLLASLDLAGRLVTLDASFPAGAYGAALLADAR